MSKNNEITKADIDYVLNVYVNAKELCERTERILEKITEKNIKEILEKNNVNGGG